MITLSKNFRFFLNITLASLAMLVIIVMQINWFIDAYRLKNELYDYKAQVALKSIVNQMTDRKFKTNKDVFCEHFCMLEKQNIVDHIDKSALDSIINAEFESLNMDMNYKYGVYRKSDSTFILGNFKGNEKELLFSQYTISLSCVSSCIAPDNFFYLTFIFPLKERFILKQLIIPVLISVIFFLLLILTYYNIISYYLKLLRLSTIKADFINNLTHEFKTPIATISIAHDMLKMKEVVNDVEKRTKYLNIINNENERLKSHVNQILYISLIEKGDVSLNTEKADVHQIIQKCIAEHEEIIKQKNGTLTTSLLASDVWANIDKIHFYNALSNLIDNALKYTGQNPVIKIVTSNNNDKISISVSDNGMGIAKEHLNKIFNQFYRVPTGNRHNIKGFGLGLYYVKTIVNLFKGDIIVLSETGKGSTFTIVLNAIY